MTGAGIMASDQVMVRKCSEATDSEIVVAYVPGDGNVVKRFSRASDGSAAFLVSENPAYAPIPVTEEIRLQGRVVSVLRDIF